MQPMIAVATLQHALTKAACATACDGVQRKALRVTQAAEQRQRIAHKVCKPEGRRHTCVPINFMRCGEFHAHFSSLNSAASGSTISFTRVRQSCFTTSVMRM